jgi:hypothetical protein
VCQGLEGGTSQGTDLGRIYNVHQPPPAILTFVLYAEHPYSVLPGSPYAYSYMEDVDSTPNRYSGSGEHEEEGCKARYTYGYDVLIDSRTQYP